MNRDELMLDLRTKNDLCKRVEELAASYVPEWRFDRNDPDIGSTLALIYTEQMAENIRRFNQLPEKYHTEFVNLLGMTLKSAYPASGVAVVEPMRGTVPGVALPGGTHLMADGGDGSPILFETVGDVYITTARISDIISISGVDGRILPVIGGPSRVKLTEDEETEPYTGGLPFRLFDFSESGVERNAFAMYHKNVFGADPDIPIQIKFTANGMTNVTKLLADTKKYRWSYFSDGGLCEFDSVKQKSGTIILSRKNASVPVDVNGERYHMICVEAIGAVRNTIEVTDIRIASKQTPKAPELMLHNGEELNAAECLPFGETVSLFDECYICDNRVFTQYDADITLSFSLSTRKKLLQLTVEQQEEELKVIKKRTKVAQFNTAYTSPERVIIEYFNGSAWRKLPCSQSVETLFDGTHAGDINISFRCPDDWKNVPINSYEGRSLRLRVAVADNCYLLPCEHTMPVLSDVKLSYEYTDFWKKPHIAKTICGTLTSDISKELHEEKAATLFTTPAYPEAALYMGFDRPLEGSPISVLFEVEESVCFGMDEVTFEYSTRNGFKPMKVIDGTNNFSSSGTVLFMPPSDFAEAEVEGLRRYWIRIRGSESAVDGYHAPVTNILLNAVDIKNMQTRAEETFYVDTAVPNMTFRLAAKNILNAEVFVNELGELSRHRMRKMAEEEPENVRVEYDSFGEIREFFVRWHEVENFDMSSSGDRHYMLDRSNGTLIFGDGVHVKIPQAKTDAAIHVRPTSCDGARGNLPAGAIDNFFGNVMYTESVYNPVPTYAGSDLEDLDSARGRGANIISGRNRLISRSDYVRAVKAFSGTIKKVKCLAGVDINGNDDPSLITIAVMTEDYATGAYSFGSIREPLTRSLLEKSDATVSPENLIVSEPMYVEISVSVWVKADETIRAFNVRNMIIDSISDFVDPMPRPGHGGWEIGSVPSENQIKMLLQSLHFDGHISRIIVVAKYTDKNGVHEVSLDRLPTSPFAIAVSGEHNVYIEF